MIPLFASRTFNPFTYFISKIANLKWDLHITAIHSFYQSIIWWKNNIYMEDLSMYLKIISNTINIILHCKCKLKCRTWICYNFISLLFCSYFISLLLNKQAQRKNVPLCLTLELSRKSKEIEEEIWLKRTKKGWLGNNRSCPEK